MKRLVGVLSLIVLLGTELFAQYQSPIGMSSAAPIMALDIGPSTAGPGILNTGNPIGTPGYVPGSPSESDISPQSFGNIGETPNVGNSSTTNQPDSHSSSALETPGGGSGGSGSAGGGSGMSLIPYNQGFPGF